METIKMISKDEVLIDGDLFIKKTLNPFDIKDFLPTQKEIDELAEPYTSLKNGEGATFVYAGIYQMINFIKEKLQKK